MTDKIYLFLVRTPNDGQLIITKFLPINIMQIFKVIPQSPFVIVGDILVGLLKPKPTDVLITQFHTAF